jgi:hypothetical protein
LPEATPPGTSQISDALFRAIAESVLRDGAALGQSDPVKRVAAMMLLQADARAAELSMRELHNKSAHTLPHNPASVPFKTETNMNVYSPRFGSATRKTPLQLAPLMVGTRPKTTDGVCAKRNGHNDARGKLASAGFIGNDVSNPRHAAGRREQLKRHRMNRLGLSKLTFMDDDITEAERYLTYFTEKLQDHTAQLQVLEQQVATRNKLAYSKVNSHLAPARQSQDFCRPMSGPDRLRAGLFNRKLFDKAMRLKQLENEVKERQSELTRKKLVRYNYIQAQANRVTHQLQEKWKLERQSLMKKRRFIIKYERVHSLSDPVPALLSLEEEAAVVLQSFGRMVDKRRRYKVKLGFREVRASNIQRVWRGRKDRALVRSLRQQRTCATHIQRTYRGRLGRRKYGLVRTRYDAAVAIECGVRCYMARRERRARQHQSERQIAAVRMQCFARTCQAHKVRGAKLQIRRRDVGALKIQQGIRSRLARDRVRVRRGKRNAAVSIQCMSRQRHARVVTAQRRVMMAELRARVVARQAQRVVDILVANGVGYGKATLVSQARHRAIQRANLARETVRSIVNFEIEARRRLTLVAQAQARVAEVEAELYRAFELERRMSQEQHTRQIASCVATSVFASATQKVMYMRSKRIASALAQANAIWAEAATAGIDAAVLRRVRHEASTRLYELAKQHETALNMQREELRTWYESQSRAQSIRTDLAIGTVLSDITPVAKRRAAFRVALQRAATAWVRAEWRGLHYARKLYRVPLSFFKQIATDALSDAVRRSEAVAQEKREREARMHAMVSQIVHHVTSTGARHALLVSSAACAVVRDAVNREVARHAAPALVASYAREAVRAIGDRRKEQVVSLVALYCDTAIANIAPKPLPSDTDPTEVLESMVTENVVADALEVDSDMAPSTFTSMVFDEATTSVVNGGNELLLSSDDEARHSVASQFMALAAIAGATRAKVVRDVAQLVLRNTKLGETLVDNAVAGHDDESVTVQVRQGKHRFEIVANSPTLTIGQVKHELSQHTSVPVEQMKLLVGGQVRANDEPLVQCCKTVTTKRRMSSILLFTAEFHEQVNRAATARSTNEDEEEGGN